MDDFPEETAENRYREPLRSVAIRIRKKQGELFGDGSAVNHFAVLSYNVLTALKRLARPAELLAARPAELLAARPKRLRFLIFNTPGKLARHARQMILRLTRGLNRFNNWPGAMTRLPVPSTA